MKVLFNVKNQNFLNSFEELNDIGHVGIKYLNLDGSECCSLEEAKACTNWQIFSSASTFKVTKVSDDTFEVVFDGRRRAFHSHFEFFKDSMSDIEVLETQTPDLSVWDVEDDLHKAQRLSKETKGISVCLEVKYTRVLNGRVQKWVDYVTTPSLPKGIFWHLKTQNEGKTLDESVFSLFSDEPERFDQKPPHATFYHREVSIRCFLKGEEIEVEEALKYM